MQRSTVGDLHSQHERSTGGNRVPRASTHTQPQAALLALQRQAGNQAVATLFVQRVFLDPAAAVAAFGPAFRDGHLYGHLPKINALVEQLPAEPRQWMEALNDNTKHSLLQQVGAQGLDIMVRIVRNLATRQLARYPAPANDTACWKFLLEIARPDTFGKDFGPLGQLPEWISKLRQIYADADKHAEAYELQGFLRATAAGRKHLADVREYSVELGEVDIPLQPQVVMSYLTRELSNWLRTLYQGAAAALGLTDYVLLGVGSVGREEMFPRSDVDYSVLVSAVTDKVKAVDDLIALQLKEMGEPDLDALSEGPPHEVAREHLVEKRDVLLDARTLHAEGRGRELEAAYLAARRKEMGDQARRHEIATSLIDTQSTKFSPTGEYLRYEDKDVKKGLLRLPTFIVRNLALYHGRETAELNVWARIHDLVGQGHLAPALATDMLFVIDFASGLRIKLHNFYQSENETFRVAADVDEAYRGYVLTADEETKFQRAEATNKVLFALSKSFSLARSMTLDELRSGAAEEKPVEAPGTGRDRDTTVRTTAMRLKDGHPAKLEEILSAGSVVYKRVQLNDEEYVAEASTGILKTRNGKTIYKPSDGNPFAPA